MEQSIAPTKLNPQLPAHIETAVLKAMAKERSDRFPGVSAFIAALRASDSSTSQKTRAEWLSELIGIMMAYPGDKKKIIDACDNAIQVDPLLPDAYFCKGIALNDLKRYHEALVAFERAIQLDPPDGFAWLYKGDILKQLGRLEEAQQA